MKIRWLENHTLDLDNLHEDIVTNFDNILICMDEDPFSRIMAKYGSSVDYIQKQYEENKVDTTLNYEEIIEHPRRVEAVNNAVQTCMTLIVALFDQTVGVVTNSLGSSLHTSQLDQPVLSEEMKKINECFYSAISKNIIN